MFDDDKIILDDKMPIAKLIGSYPFRANLFVVHNQVTFWDPLALGCAMILAETNNK